MIIFTLSAAAVTWSFFWLPYFRISKIEISDPLVNRQEVEEKLAFSFSSSSKFFLPKNNFFLFPSKIAEDAIFESDLGVAEIQKKFPNKILVDFKEIKPKFLYCGEHECFYIDKNGVPYETAPIFSDSPLPILELKDAQIKLGKEIFPKNEAEFILNFESEIKNFGLSIKKINIENDIKLKMNEGWQLTLLFGNKDYKNIAQKLLLIFEQKIKDRSKLEYIDMRFPNKAFYKLISK